jgi:hypothetical protein
LFYHSILLLKKSNCVESNTDSLMKTYKTGKYVHIKKICNNHNHLEMLAIDQRPPIFNIIKEKKRITNLMMLLRLKNTYHKISLSTQVQY